MDKNLEIKLEDIQHGHNMIDENIILNNNNSNGEIVSINHNNNNNDCDDEDDDDETKQNLQLELINVKNHFDQNNCEYLRDADVMIENDNLKKELTSTQEKFSVMQSLVQHQSKLIELLLRLDMIKSVDEPDRREIDDLQRKIQLCFSLIDECNIKFSELTNERRRVLIIEDNDTPPPPKIEKRAAIWNHFTVLDDQEGEKNVECNYCGKCFAHRNMNASKCRDHINDKCDQAPDEIKTAKPRKYSNPSPNGSKYTVWNYFINSMKDGKATINCIFCGIEYSSRNATKCREHLAFKCRKIGEDVRMEMRSTFSQEYINSYNKQKRSTIWEHFCIINDDDKTVIQCIYCCMNYANKNATKCREHLLERCDKIPINIRHKINNSFFESPLKTWTQIKIPIWKHFSMVTLNGRRQYQCNYCQKIYSSKNVTKFRLHLLYKCDQIPDDVRTFINIEMSRSTLKTDDDDDEDENVYEYETRYLKDEDDDDEEEEVIDDDNDNNHHQNDHSHNDSNNYAAQYDMKHIHNTNNINESLQNNNNNPPGNIIQIDDQHNNYGQHNEQSIIKDDIANHTRSSLRCFKRKRFE